MASDPELLPMASDPELLPMASDPELLPMASDPELLPNVGYGTDAVFGGHIYEWQENWIPVVSS